MGANILRQDDLYSFQVITQTIDTVIPPLIKVIYILYRRAGIRASSGGKHGQKLDWKDSCFCRGGGNRVNVRGVL